MKKLILVAGVILLLVGAFFFFPDKPVISPITEQGNTHTQSQTQTIQAGEQKTSLFVPYWSLSTALPVDEYDTLIYFGITPGARGINTEDVGYTSLARFQASAGEQETFLTLRMLDSKQNFAILENTSRQEILIDETIRTAKEHGFEGIVLDLEVSALPFDSLIKQISTFNSRFYAAAKKQDLHYAVALYGDTFFRIRPFDVKAIAEHSDEVMIMAYDFHKSRGNPGPNFPLNGKDRFGYDYTRLIEQFGNVVPKENITVIFGFFGYDWAVNKDKNMITHGEALSYHQINGRFLIDCQFASCSQKRDSLSSESVVSYTDDQDVSHLVWFEDQESVAKKQAFLESQGIRSYSYWAHSYF